MELVDQHQRRFFAVILLALLGLALLLVLPIWRTIILGGILGMLLYPVRCWLANRLHVRPLIASILVYLLFVAAIAAPLTLVVTFAGQGAAEMAKTLSADPTPTTGEQDESAADGGLEKAWENFAGWLRSGAADGFAAIAKEVDELIGAALDFVIGFVLFSVFLVAFNHHYVPLRSFLLQVSPLPDTVRA